MVFSMQGIGILLAPIIGLVFLSIARPSNVDSVWRVCLGFGCIPGLLILYSRYRMHETEAFRAVARAPAFPKLSELKAHARDLLATSGSWFIFDVVFYSNALFSATIMSEQFQKPNTNDVNAVHSYLKQITAYTFYLALIALPGYFAGVFMIDRIGRRKLQLLGFLGMTISYAISAAVVAAAGNNYTAFFLLYALSFFFCNCGPNVTTFVIPAELFPTAIRATSHGISAAAGKLGAAVGAAMLKPILDSSGLSVVLVLSAILSVLGLVFTWCLTRESQHLDIMSARETENVSAIMLTVEDEFRRKKKKDKAEHKKKTPNRIESLEMQTRTGREDRSSNAAKDDRRKDFVLTRTDSDDRERIAFDSRQHFTLTDENAQNHGDGDDEDEHTEFEDEETVDAQLPDRKDLPTQDLENHDAL